MASNQTNENSEKFGLLLPCYNSAHFLPSVFTQITDWKNRYQLQGLKVFFINDGSTDPSAQLIQNFCQLQPQWTELINFEQNRGKGLAIKRGFQLAHQQGYEKIIFTDADLHYGLTIINQKILPELKHFDLVMVDRSWNTSAQHQSLKRKVASTIFNRIVAIFTGVNFRDSQAGLKGFNTITTKPLFDLQTLNGFSFDVELISMALFYRLKILQVPVVFENQYTFPTTSSLNLVKESLQMFKDVMKIYINWKKGRYRSPELIARVNLSQYKISR